MLKKISLISVSVSLFLSTTVFAKNCENLPSFEAVKKALVDSRKQTNGGLNLDMWATIVDRSGVVCAVSFSGETVDAQWPGSRVISAQKANTANSFSLKSLALSTANLYSLVQPGGSLFGLQESNPVNTQVAYSGDVVRFGTDKDPMLGERIGGVNVFGGGLALYNDKGVIVGALGVSGDTSCADHNIAWRMRSALNMDYVPAGVSPQKNDQIIFDIKNAKSKAGFGHPSCGGKEVEISAQLPASRSLNAATKK